MLSVLPLLLGLVINAHSATILLAEIEATGEKALPIDVAQPLIPCDQVAKRLDDYNKLARQHDTAVSTFVYQVADKVGQWHATLSPLENTPQTLPSGLFSPLQDGQTKINDVANLAMDNSGLLANEMDRIQQSLAQCVLTAR